MTRFTQRADFATVTLLALLALPTAAQTASQPPLEPRQLAPVAAMAPTPALLDTPGGLVPGADPFMLLENNREVQVDLGLTEQQIRRLGDTGQLFRAQVLDLARSTDPAAKVELERANWTSRGAIAHLLSPEQLRRLQEIMLQIQGPCLAIGDQRLGQDLDLSDDQVARMRTVCEELAGEMSRAFTAPVNGTDQCAALNSNRQRLAQIHRESRMRVVALLSEQQQQTLRRLEGAEFSGAPAPSTECDH